MSSSKLDVLETIFRVIVGCVGLWSGAYINKQIIVGIGRLTKRKIDNFVFRVLFRAFIQLGYLTVFLWALDAAPLNGSGDYTIHNSTRVIVVILLVRLANNIFLRLTERGLIEWNGEIKPEMLLAFAPMIRALIWVFGLLIYLQNRGVGFTAIFAALAGAGIGLGFALQGPAKDFTNYITILLDKPFSVGQLIKYDAVVAQVEKVGIRSTQLRSIDGERVIVSHEDLLDATLFNLADIPRRRLLHTIKVKYDTPIEILQELPNLIKRIVTSIEGSEFGRCHFMCLGDNALEFEVVFYISNNDYIFALDIQHRINLRMVSEFNARGIEFAYPTQTLYIEKNRALSKDFGNNQSLLKDIENDQDLSKDIENNQDLSENEVSI
uniref:Small-conductance mechanosensitive channel n=1 Tax=Paulinella chromatophora TaxID=39717 RepID=B1X5L1_PAUCH|nr:small-conductance mechanosensitive channel [Paulinella chromatophora]ACB43230.1 small-conductance mechanosensitive channel [Paulinella chromatophora]